MITTPRIHRVARLCALALALAIPSFARAQQAGGFDSAAFARRSRMRDWRTRRSCGPTAS